MIPQLVAKCYRFALKSGPNQVYIFAYSCSPLAFVSPSEIVFRYKSLVLIGIEIVTLIDIHHDEIDTSRGHSQIHKRLNVSVLGVSGVDVNNGRNGRYDPFVGLATVEIRPGPFHLTRVVFSPRWPIELHENRVLVQLAYS